MEVELKKRLLSCLEPCLQEVRTGEQTLEIRLPDEYPDLGRILAAWGQPVLRSKEWSVDSISCSAGLMAWALYAPEDGSAPKVLEGWLPFQLRWDLPPDTPEGKVCLDLRTRFVDARAVNARKILIRGAISAWAGAVVGCQKQLYSPGELPPGVQLQKKSWPVALHREAGEKRFAITEELPLPESLANSPKPVYVTLTPQVQEARVIPGRVILRGSGNLHLCCQGPDGSLQSMDFQLPFSQYSSLEENYENADAQVTMAVTSLELEPGEQGGLALKAGLLAQYRILDRILMETVTDGYCPGRAMELTWEDQNLPLVLDQREVRLAGSQKLPCAAESVVDAQLLADHPRFRSQGEEVQAEFPGYTQVLYRDREGELQGVSGRWELKQTIPCADHVTLEGAAPWVEPPQLLPGQEALELSWSQSGPVTAFCGEPMAMVTGFTLGECAATDPHRPSLILKRTGEERLWALAKAAGSTVEAIRSANGLSEEPKPGTLLLIPMWT